MWPTWLSLSSLIKGDCPSPPKMLVTIDHINIYMYGKRYYYNKLQSLLSREIGSWSRSIITRDTAFLSSHGYRWQQGICPVPYCHCWCCTYYAFHALKKANKYKIFSEKAQPSVHPIPKFYIFKMGWDWGWVMAFCFLTCERWNRTGYL